MKAIVYHNYGSVSNLAMEEAAKPAPGDHEVLIKVQAASVNSWDWDLLKGMPLIVRLAGGGLLAPKRKILGCDVAGTVEATGRSVKRLQPGDEVVGDVSGCHWGTFAEYVCADEEVLALKPADLRFEEAASVPQAGVLAWQGLLKYGAVEKDSKVLINGAGGGVGTFAIQIAKMYGAQVTAVDHPAKLGMLRSLGADHVIDYTQEDFTQNTKQYDLILDVMVRHSGRAYRRVLGDTGKLVMIGGNIPRVFRITLGQLLNPFRGAKKLGILAHQPDRKDLEAVMELMVAGKVKPVIDRIYPLSKVPEAMQYMGEGRAKGKLVIGLNKEADL